MPFLILVIEPFEGLGESICEILELSGYEALCTRSSAYGVELASDLLPDLVICNISVDAHDAYWVHETLANKPRTCHIPMIISTTHTNINTQRLSVDHFILKPFPADELLMLVEWHLRDCT